MLISVEAKHLQNFLNNPRIFDILLFKTSIVTGFFFENHSVSPLNENQILAIKSGIK